MPRVDVSMSAAEVAEYLRVQRTAVLVTMGPDGRPDPVAMWYVVDADGRIVMRTYARSQKAVNLRRDPQVSVLVEDGDRYGELRGVQITGDAALDDDVEHVLDVVAGLAAKYEQVDAIDRTALLDYARKQVVVTVHPERVVSWDFARIGSS